MASAPAARPASARRGPFSTHRTPDRRSLPLRTRLIASSLLPLVPAPASPGWSTLRAVLRYYPFTLIGTAVLAAAGYLAGSAFATDNGYEFVLATAAVLVLSVLAGDGRLQARRMAAATLAWESGRPLSARTDGVLDLKAAGAGRPHYFYRLHARVTGRLRAGSGAAVYLRAEVSSASEELPLRLHMPVCGELALRARLAVRDVFGLTRSHLPGRDERRVLAVLPAPLAMRSAPRIDAAVGDDTTQRRRASDEERYYMREYEPGDRLKDINWKASSRAGELITRISPVSQQQTRLLHVEFRHFRPPGPDTLDSTLHLDYLKSWLLAFLRAVKAEHEDFTFRVATGESLHDVDTVDDIDELARHLALITFAPAPEHPREMQPHELFIFTTAFDAGLATHVARLGDTTVHLYRTVSAVLPRKAASPHPDGGDRIRLALLRPAGGARTGAPFLPGAWTLRRERFMLGPSVRGPNVHVEDEPLEVCLS